ncbi:MAG TPA: hypothetical protein VHS05_07290, partial [Pyrinomonadaceae bacterium]|nr:hypothetical protein [Pyrinomonadaceae bacterium]
MPETGNYVFLPWVRQGAAAGIETPDNRTAKLAPFVSVGVEVIVNQAVPGVRRQVRLYGPGDVVG